MDHETHKKLVKACIKNADDLLEVAKKSDELKKHNITYHLGILALEEIGKIALISMFKVSETRNESEISTEKWFDDHQRKLFWAFFGAAFDQDTINRKKIEELQNLSKVLHLNRLETLYVNPYASTQKKIKEKEVESLLKIASARLEIEKNTTIVKANKQDVELMKWFFDTCEDQAKRKMVFGSKSMEKLQELHSVKKWIKWIRKVFQKSEKESLELAKQELKRSLPKGKTEFDPKWSIKLQIYSASHSIRKGALNNWNKGIEFIKLTIASKDKKSMYVDFILPDTVPVQGLWQVGWSMGSTFLMALNIGTRGFFWWTLPEHTGRYYKKIKDLKNDAEVVVERSPKLSLDWGHLALDEKEIRKVQTVFIHLERMEKKYEPVYAQYRRGLTLLGKLDVHFECQSSIFQDFADTLKKGFEIYGDWGKKTDYTQQVIKYFEPILKTTDDLK